jgi:hypothetical protein
MNQRFLGGLVEGFGTQEVEVVVDTLPGHCCAKLSATRR